MELKRKYSSMETIEDIDFGDFNLTIIVSKKQFISYYACLSYQGKDKNFINEINELKKNEEMDKEEDLCLIRIVFGVQPFSALEGDYVVEDKEEKVKNKIKFRIPSNAHLFGYYNDIRKYNLQGYEQTKKLKGIVHIIFCDILANALSENYITLDSIITLEASGALMKSEEEIKKEIESGLDDSNYSTLKDMLGLVKHYETLGFKQSLPQLLAIGLENANIPMQGKVKDILEVCVKNPESKVKAIEKIRIIKKEY